MCELTHTRRNFGCPNGGLPVMPDTFTNAHRVEITPLAARYRLSATYAFLFFAEIGELMLYGNDQADDFRRAGDLRRSLPQGCEAK